MNALSASGADGIGLLRTEYLFRGRSAAPTLEEQEEAYAGFIEQTNGHLTVRALDAGGDKPVRYITHRHEDNPFLGLRGIRLLIEQPALLRTQYAALQAAASGARENIDVRFMLPMISNVEEVHAVRRILAEADSGVPPLALGIMIEVPSAALIAGALAPSSTSSASAPTTWPNTSWPATEPTALLPASPTLCIRPCCG